MEALEIKKLTLIIDKESELSDFTRDMVIEEAEKHSTFDDLAPNSVNIVTSYVCEVEDKIEAGIFIRNTSSNRINFEEIPLILVKDNKIIGNETFKNKELGDVEANTIKYVVIRFHKGNVFTDDLDNSVVMFSQAESLTGKRTVKSELVNIPEDFPQAELKKINEFIEKLPYLNKDTVDITKYSMFYDEEGNLCIILIIRNGYTATVNIDHLPISIFNSNDVLIYTENFHLKEINIPGSGSALASIVVNEEEVPVKDADLDTCKLIFKQ